MLRIVRLLRLPRIELIANCGTMRPSKAKNFVKVCELSRSFHFVFISQSKKTIEL